ncbi:MAG: hypothetical protein ACFCBW_17700 [Candidatus Competibacterales bacterium]
MTALYAQRRRAQRLRFLYRCGLATLQEALKALDAVKEQLTTPLNRDGAQTHPQNLKAVLQNLSGIDSPLRLTLKSQGFWQRSFEVRLESTATMADYIVDVERHNAPDPLGVRSLLGILHHYGVRLVEVRAVDDDASDTTLTLDDRHRRRFRREDAPEAQLRALIDQVLWGRQRVYLSPVLVNAFRRMEPERRAHLQRQGLRAVRAADGLGYTLYRAVQRQAPSVEGSVAENGKAPGAAADGMPEVCLAHLAQAAPGGLEVFIEAALDEQKPQFVPNTPEYCRFLTRPDAVAFLNSHGLGLYLPPLRRDGGFERTAFIYPLNLDTHPQASGSFESEAPTLPTLA